MWKMKTASVATPTLFNINTNPTNYMYNGKDVIGLCITEWKANLGHHQEVLKEEALWIRIDKQEKELESQKIQSMEAFKAKALAMEIAMKKKEIDLKQQMESRFQKDREDQEFQLNLQKKGLIASTMASQARQDNLQSKSSQIALLSLRRLTWGAIKILAGRRLASWRAKVRMAQQVATQRELEFTSAAHVFAREQHVRELAMLNLRRVIWGKVKGERASAYYMWRKNHLVAKRELSECNLAIKTEGFASAIASAEAYEMARTAQAREAAVVCVQRAMWGWIKGDVQIRINIWLGRVSDAARENQICVMKAQARDSMAELAMITLRRTLWGYLKASAGSCFDEWRRALVEERHSEIKVERAWKNTRRVMWELLKGAIGMRFDLWRRNFWGSRAVESGDRIHRMKDEISMFEASLEETRREQEKERESMEVLLGESKREFEASLTEKQHELDEEKLNMAALRQEIDDLRALVARACNKHEAVLKELKTAEERASKAEAGYLRILTESTLEKANAQQAPSMRVKYVAAATPVTKLEPQPSSVSPVTEEIDGSSDTQPWGEPWRSPPIYGPTSLLPHMLGNDVGTKQNRPVRQDNSPGRHASMRRSKANAGVRFD